jgi:hypothetical protein
MVKQESRLMRFLRRQRKVDQPAPFDFLFNIDKKVRQVLRLKARRDNLR